MVLFLRDCVAIMEEGGLTRDRRSDSSALECGSFTITDYRPYGKANLFKEL
jgi:hypothetical protein